MFRKAPPQRGPGAPATAAQVLTPRTGPGQKQNQARLEELKELRNWVEAENE
jgi:hypothetical protein